MDIQEKYIVKTLDLTGNHETKKVVVPGSKSITNRALFLAALSNKICIIEGALFSDDSRVFANALIELGYQVELYEDDKRAVVYGNNGKIPNNSGEIYVGSAGTAARFLTAMLGFSDGEYIINASSQMENRPMSDLLSLLKDAGAEITCLKNEGCLPVKIKGVMHKDNFYESNVVHSDFPQVNLDISKSTQFLSALLMTSSMLKKNFKINITSEKKQGSYIEITRKLMNDFGISTAYDGNSYIVIYNDNLEEVVEFKYYVEPDVSAASYFYAAAMICGFSVQVKGVYEDSMQGDIKFLKVLEKMGGKITNHKDGIIFTGPENGKYNGININMNDFSDQALTLSVVAAYGETPTVISGISHIRGQESDRITAMVTELRKTGIKCEEYPDGVKIIPGVVHGAEIYTYDDHRVAMAFSLLGLKTPGIIIINPACTKKTFENYFEVFEGLY